MPDPSPVQKRMTDVLMLADVPWVAAVIMGVAQPFAQLDWKPTWAPQGIPNPLPLLIALLVSCLIALYWVGVEEKASSMQALLVTPVVAMMLFAASLGVNNVAKAASTSAPATEADLHQQLQNVQQQNELLTKQLGLERQKVSILAAPSAPPATTSRRDETGAAAPSRWVRALAWIEGEAQAQQPPAAPPAGLTAEQKKAQLDALDKQQKQLEEQQRQLEQQRGATPSPGTGSIWKKF